MKTLHQIKQSIQVNRKQFSVILALTLFVIALGFTVAFNLTKDITIEINQNQKNLKLEQVTLQNINMNKEVGEVLTENQISTDGYTVAERQNALIRDIDTIHLTKNAVGNISVDNKKIAYDSAVPTVGDLLAQNDVSLGEHDTVSPAIETALTTDIKDIKVDRVEYKEEQRTAAIPFDTKQTEDADLTKDEIEVDTDGVEGEKLITEKVKYVNGKRDSAETLKEEVKKEPVTQVQRIGTKVVRSSSSSSGSPVSVGASDFDVICAIVAHEGGTSYDGAAAVMSAVMNRVDAGYADGTPLGVLTAPGQFSSYLQGYYQQYLGAAIPEVRQAVTDCLNGYRMHPYRNFHAGHGSGEFIVNQTFY